MDIGASVCMLVSEKREEEVPKPAFSEGDWRDREKKKKKKKMLPTLCRTYL